MCGWGAGVGREGGGDYRVCLGGGQGSVGRGGGGGMFTRYQQRAKELISVSPQPLSNTLVLVKYFVSNPIIICQPGLWVVSHFYQNFNV